MRFMVPSLFEIAATLRRCNLCLTFIDLHKDEGTPQAGAGTRRDGNHTAHATPVAWLLPVRADPQPVTGRAASAADVPETSAPPAGNRRRPHPRARQAQLRALRERYVHGVEVGAS